MRPLLRRSIAALLAPGVALAVAACGAASVTPAGPPVGPGASAATPAASPGAAAASPSTPTRPPGPSRPTGPTQEATLVRVVDGDTIRVIVGGVEEPVRYIGIDTPEPHPDAPATPDPYADNASDANARLLAGGRIVLEKDVSERDRYGRLLRDVWVERDGSWTLVNLALVADGHAQVTTYPPDVRYVDLLLAAQRAARADGRGLWSDRDP